MKLAAWLLSSREEGAPDPENGAGGSWRDQLPEFDEVAGKNDKGEPVTNKVPLRGDLSLKDIKDLPGLARAYRDTKKMVGAATKIPGADAKLEERRAFYDKLGVPKDVDGYKVEVPKYEGVTIRDDTMAKVKGLALKHGVLPAALQELTNAVVEDMAGSREQMVKAWQDSHEETIEKEWGENLKANAERARRTFETFFGGKDGEVAKLMVATGLEHHPGILKGFYALSKHFREHPYISGEVAGEMGAKEAEGKRSALRQELMKDSTTEADRRRILGEIERLARAQYGSAEA